MKTIFISYRRIDSYETNRLANSLKGEYGENNIFLDYESIHGGKEWQTSIKEAVEECSVFILMIGKNWLFLQDEDSGKRKIDMEEDWVRKEIVTFLKRYREDKELLFLPVLINGAKMPKMEHFEPS